MSLNKKLILAALLAPALLAGTSYAAEPGFYMGASGGQTTVDIDADDLGLTDLDSGIDAVDNFGIDDNDTGWKVFLGYQFLPWLGVEAGYIDFGSSSNNRQSRNILGGDAFDTSISADADYTGGEGFLVGTLPIGPVDLFAKVGAIYLTADVDAKASVTFDPEGIADTESFRESGDESDTQLAYGVGIAYNMGHWGLRVEAEGFDDNEVDDFYFLSAGVTYRFGTHKEPAPAPVAATPVVEEPAKCPDGDNDGVCDAVDECIDTQTGARVGTMGCNCDYSMQLEFAFDSAQLSDNDMMQLDKIVPVLNNPKAGFISGEIAGHTDSVGSEDYNLGLSKRRADSVSSFLQSRGVNLSGRFTVTGYGESTPIASNDTDAGRAQNRRVVVRRTDCAQ